MNLLNSFSNFKNTLYKNYGENPGKMLVHTGVLGWILSSLAQVCAVVFNDKISSEQKSFLIPQEIADAAVNIISFYAITNSVKTLGSKLVSTGKLKTPHITSYLKKHNLLNKENVGNINFDISKTQNFEEISKDYKNFKNGVDVVASTVGSIISCNLVTPIFRNQFAAKEQQKIAEKKQQDFQINHLKTPKSMNIADYQKMAYSKFSSGMKI